MRMARGCERANEQASIPKVTNEREALMSHHPSSLVCSLPDCRTFMNSAHITWLLTCQHASQPASQPASHFAQNSHLQLIGCVRLLHVKARSCEHASWQWHSQSIWLTHTQRHTHTKITANMITRSVEKTKETEIKTHRV